MCVCVCVRRRREVRVCSKGPAAAPSTDGRAPQHPAGFAVSMKEKPVSPQERLQRKRLKSHYLIMVQSYSMRIHVICTVIHYKSSIMSCFI